MQTSIRKIILATDFSDISKDAGYHALLLAHTYKAELKALHVFDTSAWNVPFHDYSSLEELGINRVVEGFEETRQRGKNALKELAESFDLEVETIFVEGHAGHEIILVTRELNTDLIIIGANGYDGWNRHVAVIGTVAEYVVKYAPCPVFIIRPKERQIELTHRKKSAIKSS
jgi:nucleotide-binding universal stress UspA family protein